MKLCLLYAGLILESLWTSQPVLTNADHQRNIQAGAETLSSFAITQLPNLSNNTCSEAISTIEDALAEGGYYIPWETGLSYQPMVYPDVQIEDDHIVKGYYDYPEDRTQSVTFRLTGDSGRLYKGIMNSPQLLTSYTSQIMTACQQVGLVNFQHWWEGVVPMGYFSDGSIRQFQWVNFDPIRGSAPDAPPVRTINNRSLYPWGYYYSP